ncbi:hypothetical protein EVAR_87708_1 [Eumeta japonica]|uniref:Uncharacterized protein n=1 Tax=Eumeta variegata TaxID=151549 RepID=A0A4C2A914_EUMVA|nr:hypothetical protein EVAR_87708_1 [Eumeta japonica]
MTTCSSGLQTGARVSASPITSGRVVESTYRLWCPAGRMATLCRAPAEGNIELIVVIVTWARPRGGIKKTYRKSFVILRRHLRRVKEQSVLSDDGSSGSDSTIRGSRLRTRTTTLKWSGPEVPLKRANRSNRHYQS